MSRPWLDPVVTPEVQSQHGISQRDLEVRLVSLPFVFPSGIRKTGVRDITPVCNMVPQQREHGVNRAALELHVEAYEDDGCRGVSEADGLEYRDNSGRKVGYGVVDHLAVVEVLVRPGTFTAQYGKAVRLQMVVRGDGVEIDMSLMVVRKRPWP